MRTKGEITFDGFNGRVGLCVWDKEFNHIITVEKSYPTTDKEQKEYAEHLVSCWNAFEEGGLVGELVTFINKIKVARDNFRITDEVDAGLLDKALDDIIEKAKEL